MNSKYDAKVNILNTFSYIVHVIVARPLFPRYRQNIFDAEYRISKVVLVLDQV